MLPERYSINFTTISNNKYPNFSDFYANLTPFVTFSICAAIVLLTLNLAIFVVTISKTKKHLSSHFFLPTTLLCSFYPIISLAAVVAILIPKSAFICQTVMHLLFTVGAVVFHNLCFRYAHSEASYLNEFGDQKTLDLQASPLCCCCIFLPKLTPQKTRLFTVKCLIWQMPLVQSSIMLASNLIYYKDPEMYENLTIFFTPFLGVSIVIGLWGLSITVKMISKLFPDYNLTKKMLSLQLIVLLCKLQYFILDSILDAVDFGGIYPINNTILKQTLINLLILVEMSLVSILAKNAYSLPSLEL